MDDTHKRKIRSNYVTLIQTIQTDDLLDHLYQHEVFHEEECEEVRQSGVRQKQVRTLLSILQMKVGKSYDVFVSALRDTGSGHLVDQLENTDLSDEVGEDSIQNEKDELVLQNAVVRSLRSEIENIRNEVAEIKDDTVRHDEKIATLCAVLKEEEQEQEKDVMSMATMMASHCDIAEVDDIIVIEKRPVEERISESESNECEKTKTMKEIKIVMVGDGAVGKTCLAMQFLNGRFPGEYIPTVFDNYAGTIQLASKKNIDGEEVLLGIWDTAGQEDYDQLRPLSYPKTDFFLVCFNVTSPWSFVNAEVKWVPEILHFVNKTKFLLVGTKCDLRNDLQTIEKLVRQKCSPVSYQSGEEMAKRFGAVGYLECSAKTGEGITEVFQTAASLALGRLSERKTPRGRSCCLLL